MPGILNSYTEVFKPRLAIIGYEGNQQRTQEWYFESHPIENGKMLEGRPLQQETLHAVMGLMYDKKRAEMNIHKFIPQNLIYADVKDGGDFTLVWYRPEERRAMFFAHQQELKNGVAWVPAMIYCANRKQLRVYAIDKDDYPTEETRLFQAPYYNTGGSGLVCLGSAKAQKPQLPSYENMMAYYEALFWGSEFSSGDKKIWQPLFDQPDKKYSEVNKLKETTSHPKTVRDLIK